MNLPPIPIWQAPTGSIAGPELCAAVSSAGGMGAMGFSWTDPATARTNIREVKQLTSNPFYVNFALAFEPSALDVCLEEGVPIITFSWGDPSSYLARFKDSGAFLGIQVTTADETKRALDLGADFLVCQGVEAGGHVESTTPLHEVLPETLSLAGDKPVIAAGGIANSAQIAEVLAMGASGAILGTRFVATKESRAHPEYKQALVDAGGNTTLTTCFDGGWAAPQRALRNSTLVNWESAGSPSHGSRPGEGDVLGHTADGIAIYRYDDAAPREGYVGSILEMCLYSGTGVGEIHHLPSAGDLVRELWRQIQ